jgi:4-oxalocrotonate tautomerase
MPIAQLYILEGRDAQKKERLIAEVTGAISRALDAPPESVRVLIQEMPKAHFGIGGRSAEQLGR